MAQSYDKKNAIRHIFRVKCITPVFIIHRIVNNPVDKHVDKSYKLLKTSDLDQIAYKLST